MTDAGGRFRPGWGTVALALLMGGSLGAFSLSLAVGSPEPTPVVAQETTTTISHHASNEQPGETAASVSGSTGRVDPRHGGLTIGLGEWALSPEAEVIRPGKVTFVIQNRGTMAHGFEIELERESSGSGSGSLFKRESELLQPGETTRMTVELGPAVYKIECLVDGHDDMGMEGLLEVRRGAPLVKKGSDAKDDSVAISGFAFSPSSIEVDAGTEVTWHNEDPTDHTVSSFDGVFGSDALGTGDTFKELFTEPGTYRYRCAIHPDMEGTVKVRGGEKA